MFGPEVITRNKGIPIIEEREFTVNNTDNNFSLNVINGGEEKNTKVTSCFVILNSDTLIYPNNIGKEINNIEIDISLEKTNLLTVRLAGKPGCYLTISIIEMYEPCPCTVTDIDGNIYKTIQIGEQCWLAENLRVTHFRNGDIIPKVTDDIEWSSLSSSGYCAYNNNESNADTYGYLYNWYAVDDSRNIAPVGWHVPTYEELYTLVDYLGGGSVAGGKLKEAGLDHWSSPNTGVTNESGFSAIPGGYRSKNNGNFGGINDITFFWSSSPCDDTEMWSLPLLFNSTEVSWGTHSRPHGFSVRLIKD